MRIPNILALNHSCRSAVFLAIGFLLAAPHGFAQCTNNNPTQGFNAIFGSCNNNAPQPSFATVDASQFNGDICARILASLEKYYNVGSGPQINYGIIVDARGVNPGMSQPCLGNPFAVPTPSSYEMPPSTVVLLPSGTIRIQQTWVLPAFTRIIGEGPGATILQANGLANNNTTCGSSQTPVDMIDVGCTNTNNAAFYNCSNPGGKGIVDCPGIAIEHLGLDGANVLGINGIVNNSAQELSYVHDVAFSNIAGTALSVQGIITNNPNGTSNNSGPYTNLSMSNVGTCLSINGTVGTRGVHGINCSTTGTSSAAIDIESSNNSLEDISLSGSNRDGILIGATAAAQNNVLFNISGGGFTNLIHISSKSSTTQTNCPGTVQGSGSVYNVCDLTIMGVRNASSGKTTIWDQVGGPTLTDASLGIYVLGEPVQYGSTTQNPNGLFLGNSHITTSLNWSTWLVGTSSPSNPCASVGSLYSVTGTGTGSTLWECEKNKGWAGVQ